jgi:hypothetical protein
MPHASVAATSAAPSAAAAAAAHTGRGRGLGLHNRTHTRSTRILSAYTASLSALLVWGCAPHSAAPFVW